MLQATVLEISIVEISRMTILLNKFTAKIQIKIVNVRYEIACNICTPKHTRKTFCPSTLFDHLY